MIDRRTLEAIVSEVVERLVRERPDLFDQTPPDDVTSRHSGRVLTEVEVLRCRRDRKVAIRIRKGTIVTPLARDRARDLGIEIVVE